MARSSGEWGRFVKEAAKIMKWVDPTIEIMAASTVDPDWNINLLKEVGDWLDWISIHAYWDILNDIYKPAPYETCMYHSTQIEEKIFKAGYILGSHGLLGKIRVAFDERNLRSWHHPNFRTAGREDILAKDEHDNNQDYTMADAVFAACFLNQCLRHCDLVGMAYFSPVVNTRGAIYADPDGIVLLPSCFVFELYTKYMGDSVVDT